MHLRKSSPPSAHVSFISNGFDGLIRISRVILDFGGGGNNVDCVGGDGIGVGVGVCSDGVGGEGVGVCLSVSMNLIVSSAADCNSGYISG